LHPVEFFWGAPGTGKNEGEGDAEEEVRGKCIRKRRMRRIRSDAGGL